MSGKFSSQGTEFVCVESYGMVYVFVVFTFSPLFSILTLLLTRYCLSGCLFRIKIKLSNKENVHAENTTVQAPQHACNTNLVDIVTEVFYVFERTHVQ